MNIDNKIKITNNKLHLELNKLTDLNEINVFNNEDNIEQIMVWDRSSLSSYPYNCGGYVPGIDKLRILGVLEGLPETSQLSLF